MLHNHSEIIGKNYNYGRRLMLRFESEAYYYRNYVGIASWRIALVRMIVKSYILRKNIVKQIKSLLK